MKYTHEVCDVNGSVKYYWDEISYELLDIEGKHFLYNIPKNLLISSNYKTRFIDKEN